MRPEPHFRVCVCASDVIPQTALLWMFEPSAFSCTCKRWVRVFRYRSQQVQQKQRTQWVPCQCTDRCNPDTCSCITSGHMCEKFCSCSCSNCHNAFTGCRCEPGGCSKSTCPCLSVSIRAVAAFVCVRSLSRDAFARSRYHCHFMRCVVHRPRESAIPICAYPVARICEWKWYD